MRKKKILFVGEHPYGRTGNSHMLYALVNRVNLEKYQVGIFAGTPKEEFTDPFHVSTVPIYEAGSRFAGNDYYGQDQLISVIDYGKPDMVFFVGLDVWRYHQIFDKLLDSKSSREFIWTSLFPYDLTRYKEEWKNWINPIDFPLVYSEYGYDLLKEHITKIGYFRPPHYDDAEYKPLEQEEIRKSRKLMFPGLQDDDFLFGFVGVNQFRKDPQRLIKAFFDVKKLIPKARLYLHTELAGVFNLEQFIADCGGERGDVFIKKQKVFYKSEYMAKTYNCMDCLVLPSLQEGLSWTPIEAMLCGVPTILSDSTSHKELGRDGAAKMVPCTELTYVPIASPKGATFEESRACNYHQLVAAMMEIVTNNDLRDSIKEKGLIRGREYANNPTDINTFLEEAFSLYEEGKKTFTIKNVTGVSTKQQKVLFCQHSSAGDVLMTTKALAGVKKRYGLPIDYMTMPQYMGVVEGCPLIDKVIPWDEAKTREYLVVLNPHGEKIAPGHWGRNSNALLSDFYWKLLKVEKGEFWVGKQRPSDSVMEKFSESKPLCIVHTTGGDPSMRSYKFMEIVCVKMQEKGFLTVQLGGINDYSAGAEVDLRGQLTFKETGYVASLATVGVTVDSYMSHLLGALGISQVCLFGSGNHFVVAPEQVGGKLIKMTPDFINYCPGLGPCSGVLRDCALPCTGLHDPIDIVNNLLSLCEEVKNG